MWLAQGLLKSLVISHSACQTLQGYLISKNREIDVNKQVLINFFIGNYMDKVVLCDVVPMGATHL